MKLPWRKKMAMAQTVGALAASDDRPLCDAKGTEANVRMNCGLLKGHVQTMDDWHEGTAKGGSHIKTIPSSRP